MQRIKVITCLSGILQTSEEYKKALVGHPNSIDHLVCDNRVNLRDVRISDYDNINSEDVLDHVPVVGTIVFQTIKVGKIPYQQEKITGTSQLGDTTNQVVRGDRETNMNVVNESENN